MEAIDGLVEGLQSPYTLLLVTALLAASEVLASIPQIRANSVFQLVTTILKTLARKPTE